MTARLAAQADFVHVLVELVERIILHDDLLRLQCVLAAAAARPTYLLQSRIMQTSLLFQIEFFLTSILIFPGKVKPSGRISHPKRRKHSIFVFIEKHSSKILRVDAAGNGCKIHAHGVRLQSRFTEIFNPFYTLANFFVFSIDILCTWTVISYGTDCDRAVAQHRVCWL